MDKIHLRGLILKLQDCLTDSDRQRLHFFLGNDVPRQIRDDPTLNGTLRLMESLFDQDKINEGDFTFLINAFNAIQCIDAVKLLKEHMKQVQSSWFHGSMQSLPSTIPSLIEQVISDQEDKSSTQTFILNPIANCTNNNKIINSNNTNINPLTITIDNKKILSSRSKRNQLFYISFATNKYLFLILFFLMIAFGILVGLFLIKVKELNEQTAILKQKENMFSNERKQNNQTFHHLKNVNSEKTHENEQLKKQLQEMKNETPRKSTIFIKAGQKFGIANGDYFDDSSLSEFTCHYLSGIAILGDNDTMESYQFLYSSDNDYENPIESQIHGDRNSIIRKKFQFDPDEKIYKVQGQIIHENVVYPHGINKMSSRITGLQFFSTEGRASPSYNGQLGETFIEEFEGYTLGYMTGRSTEYIQQLQLLWYRTVDKC